MSDISSAIKQKAIELGFDLAGVTIAEPVCAEETTFFARWLDEGRAAGMSYLHRNIEKRFCPAKHLRGARSVVCVGLNYRPAVKRDYRQGDARIADYALYEDYHIFIKERLKKLGEFIAQRSDAVKAAFKVCVDTAPLAERSLARRAGLGFIGKNHSLINPHIGCQLLLGEVITTAELEADRPVDNGCGDCRKCIEACPTGALQADGGFDSRKCLSFLTIEHKGDLPAGISGKLEGRVFGCDACLLACPFGANGPVCQNREFKFYPQRMGLTLEQILRWGKDDFEKMFKGSAVQRTGLEKLKQNAKACLAGGRF